MFPQKNIHYYYSFYYTVEQENAVHYNLIMCCTKTPKSVTKLRTHPPAIIRTLIGPIIIITACFERRCRVQVILFCGYFPQRTLLQEHQPVAIVAGVISSREFSSMTMWLEVLQRAERTTEDFFPFVSLPLSLK